MMFFLWTCCVCLCVYYGSLNFLSFSCHWILLFSDWCQYCSCESKISCVFDCTEFTDFLHFVYIFPFSPCFIHLLWFFVVVCWRATRFVSPTLFCRIFYSFLFFIFYWIIFSIFLFYSVLEQFFLQSSCLYNDVFPYLGINHIFSFGRRRKKNLVHFSNNMTIRSNSYV